LCDIEVHRIRSEHDDKRCTSITKGKDDLESIFLANLSGALKVTKEETRGSATIDELTEFRNSVKKVEYRNYFDIQHNI
jgi:hypothetical protein